MVNLFRFISKFLNGERTISESANGLEYVFNDTSEGQEFFNLVFAKFEQYDESNRAHHNDHFSADIDFITQYAITSLTSTEYSHRFPGRIDAYFYIYRRIAEYNNYVTGSDSQLKQFREKLFQQLESLFRVTKGTQPNIVITNPDLMRRIDIQQHLSSIKEISDIATLNTFFALCKLTFQSSFIVNDHGCLQWVDILSKISLWKMPITDFISQYMEYRQAFQQFPLDIPAFIYLISKTHPSKNVQESPFVTYHNFLKEFNLIHKTFFEQFQPMFADGMKQKVYTLLHIAPLFQMLSARNDHLFSNYLTVFSSNVNNDDLWTMFLYLSKNDDINQSMQKHLSLVLTQRTQNVPIETFKRYYQLAKECLKQMKDENREKFLKIFETVLHAYLDKQLNNEEYSYKFTQSYLKEFLSIILELLSTQNLQHPSCLLIIRHLLFKLDKHTLSKCKKIECVFERLNDFDRNLCETNDPAVIIQDEWLNDYIFNIPQDWWMVRRYEYQRLRDIHHDNRWSIHIWSRIVTLSLLKSETAKPNEMLTKLNEWMIDVKQDNNDILTTIFVKNVFEIVIVKHMKSILSLPNIGSIVEYIRRAKQEQPCLIDIKQVDDFIQNVQHSVQNILLLNGTPTTYRELSNTSIVYNFLHLFDLKTILTLSDPMKYTFPVTTLQIDSIVSIKKPNNINITEIQPKHEYFDRFIQQVNDWVQWFDKFIDIFQYVIELLKIWKMDGAEQLFSDIHTARHDSTITVIKIKILIQNILKVLKPFNNLQRLCDLFNCLQSFEIIGTSTLSNRDQFKSYISELKNLHPNNTFIVNSKGQEEKCFPIYDRRHVQWSIACTQHHCNIKIEYRPNGSLDQNHELFDKKDVPLDIQFLQGEFKTQRAGQLVITINNQTGHVQRTLWYSITQNGLSTCHLFQGIFNMYYQKYFNQSTQLIKENELSKLIDQVFSFIDNLLNGNTTLQEVDYLKTVFHDKNINVRQEVQKLFANRSVINNEIQTATTVTLNSSRDQQIEQVCEWLRIYQYYSHLSIIIDCVKKFHIVSNSDKNDESIDYLQEITINENCSLKEISETHKDLYLRFRKLTNHHLQLIKIIVEGSNIVEMMKKFDLYSTRGLRRFQELRDNLTTQFQLQERNSMILNSWIITYALCEPFVRQVENLEEFVDNLARLSNIDESSLEHIKGKLNGLIFSKTK